MFTNFESINKLRNTENERNQIHNRGELYEKDEDIANLPKPFGLFDSYDKQQEQSEPLDNTTKPIIKEGFDNTDDVKQNKTFLSGMLVAVFFILSVIIGIIYFFNSSILFSQKLLVQPFYTKTDFWNNYKGNMVGSKITIFLFIWLVIACLNLLLLDTVFNNHEWGNIFYISTIYSWSIVGSTMLLIGNIPSLVDVFENTLGYSILKTPFFKLDRTMSMFKNRNFKSDQFKIPCDFLITTFNIPSFHDYFDELCSQYPSNADYSNPPTTYEKPISDFYIDLHTWLKSDSELATMQRADENLDPNDTKSLSARRELLKQVLTKNTIGHYTWVLLASFVSVLLTMNTIIQ